MCIAVRQVFFAVLQPALAQADTYRREAARLRDVRQRLLASFQPGQAQVDAHVEGVLNPVSSLGVLAIPSPHPPTPLLQRPPLASGGKAGLLIRKHDHYTPTSEIRRRHQGLHAAPKSTRGTGVPRS